ncbi:DUF523 domain-containing protein [Gemmatimonadota bacterium]
MRSDEKIRLGISACLLGEPVRYDGGHKRDRYLTDILGQYVEYIPVCPEHECGLPVPREAMCLVGDPDDPRLVTIDSQIDYTEQMKRFSEPKMRKQEYEYLSGFIFKANSPSCGIGHIQVYDREGVPAGIGMGIFARLYMEYYPHAVVGDEGELNDPGLSDILLTQIFAGPYPEELK